MALGYLAPFSRGGSSRGGRPGGSPLFDLHRQMNSLFDNLLEQDAQGQTLGGRTGFPALDISQNEKQIEVCAELPGVREEDIELHIEDGVLSLSGEKKSSRKDEESGYSERSYGRFERRVSLPANVDEDACQASFTDGVLTITIPKSEEKARGRRIPVGKGQSPDGKNASNATIEQNSSSTR